MIVLLTKTSYNKECINALESTLHCAHRYFNEHVCPGVCKGCKFKVLCTDLDKAAEHARELKELASL